MDKQYLLDRKNTVWNFILKLVLLWRNIDCFSFYFLFTMKNFNDIKILNTNSEEHFRSCKKLISGLEDTNLINEYFDPKVFEKAVLSLSGKYLKPIIDEA